MTLLGGTGEHLGTSFAVDGIAGLFVESTKMTIINTGGNAVLRFQGYLELLEEAIHKLNKCYPGERKLKKKLTPKGRLIQEGKELQRWIHLFGPGAVLLAVDDFFYKECLGYASELATNIVEKIELQEIHLFKSGRVCMPATPENITEVRQGVKELLEGVTLFVAKVEKVCKPFVSGVKERPNIPQTESRVKDTKVVVATIMGKNPGNKNKEKFGKIGTRLTNIESALGKGLKPDKSEIETMLANLNLMKNLSEGESLIRDSFLERIGKILIPEDRVLHRTETIIQKPAKHTTATNVDFDENEKHILSIWRYILSENGIHGTLSSTKSNGHTTNWDGTFVVKTLRPFLSQLVHVVYERRKVDFENTSWNELIDIYEKSVENISPHIRLFISVLKGNKKIVSFKMILIELLGAVEEISKHACFSAPSEKRLVNVQNKLEEIIERFYPE